MDFLDPKKKRAHRTRLFIGYGLMAVLIGFGTTILVFQAYGFDLNRKTGEVIQNGLVFVDSHPVKADVLLNGEPKGGADMRLVIPAGQYTVELNSNGYRGWKRSFTLEGSSIERLVYPFLFPQDLKTADSQLYASTPATATQSLDRRWILIQQPGGFNSFDLIDVSAGDPEPVTLTLPNTLLTQAGTNHGLEMVEWSNDNRHVLLKHTFETGVEFIVLDREAPTASLNLNKIFDLPLTQVTFRDKRFDQFYLYDANGGILRRGDSRTGQTALVLTNVLAFKPHGDDVILYATGQGAGASKALVRLLDGEESLTVREITVDKQYFLDLVRYDGRWYVAIGIPSEHKVSIYRDTFDVLRRTDPVRRVPVPVAVLKLDTVPEYVSFSATARFIALQGGSRFAVYDAEMDKQYRYDTKLELVAGQKATWMDGHRLTVVSQDKMVVFDYDGINSQPLVAATPKFLPFFDRDYDNLYVLGPSKIVQNRTALTRTPMRVE